MASETPPKISFPCDYPIKVMGYAGEELFSHVMAVMHCHDPAFDASRVSVRDSRNGRFQSITATITATGAIQLEAIFADLKTSTQVQMVL